MKNYRGAALANIRSSIWRVFGAEKLPLLRSNTSLANIVEWKKKPEVNDCFGNLFNKNNDDIYWIMVIARTTFNEAIVPNLTHAHCAFTLAVYDIFLNPASKSIVCTEKRMKKRIECYIVSLH